METPQKGRRPQGLGPIHPLHRLRKFLAVNHSVEEFGYYTPLLALMLLMIRAFGAFPFIATKKMSLLRVSHGLPAALACHRLLGKQMRKTLIAFSLTILALSPLIRNAAGFTTLFPILSMIVLFVISTYTVFYTSPLQAMQTFHAVGLFHLAHFILKLLATILLFSIFTDGYIAPYTKSFLAQLIAACLVFGALLLYLRRHRSDEPVAEPVRTDIKTEILPVFFLLLVHGAAAYLDEIVAKVTLIPHEAGLYGAIVTISKSLVFLIVPIVYVLFPKISSDPTGASGKRIMLKGLILITGLGLCGTACVLLFPDLIINLLTDPKYRNAGGYLKFAFVAYLPHSMLILFINFYIINLRPRYLLGMTTLLALHITALLLFNETLREIIIVTGVFGSLYLAFSFAYWLHENARGGPRPA
jgi:O-antigen/teichoic acid export membrane protein